MWCLLQKGRTNTIGYKEEYYLRSDSFLGSLMEVSRTHHDIMLHFVCQVAHVYGSEVSAYASSMEWGDTCQLQNETHWLDDVECGKFWTSCSLTSIGSCRMNAGAHSIRNRSLLRSLDLVEVSQKAQLSNSCLFRLFPLKAGGFNARNAITAPHRLDLVFDM